MSMFILLTFNIINLNYKLINININKEKYNHSLSILIHEYLLYSN